MKSISRKDIVYVVIQLAIFGIYFLPMEVIALNLPQWLHYFGMVVFGSGLFFGLIAVLQLNSNLSPFPSPVASGRLITNGIFKISRHPIYTGLLLSGFGFAIYQGSIYKTLITVLLGILFYYKSNYEEQLLIDKFPEYQDYKRRTRKFL